MKYTADDIRKLRSGNGNSSSSLSSVSQKYTAESIRKMRNQNTSFDLNSINKTNDIIQSTYGGWQDQTTMQNNRKVVSDTWSNLVKYKNNGNFTKEQGDYLDSLTDTYMQALNSWNNTADLYSNYLNADAFSKAMDKQKTEISKPKYDEKYTSLRNNADFSENSKYVSGKEDAFADGAYNKRAYERMYEYINTGNNVDDYNIGDSISEYLGSFNANKKDAVKYMTDEEKEYYNYLYSVEGGQSANNFLNSIYEDLSGRSLDESMTKLAEWQKNSGFLGNALAVAGASAGEIGMAASAFGNITNNTTSARLDSMFNPNNNMNTGVSGALAYADAVRSNFVDKYTADTDSKILNEASKIVSMAASEYLPQRIGQTVFGPAYDVVMGNSAFLSTYRQAKLEGLSQESAVYKGTAAGIIEFLTEFLGMDFAFADGNTIARTLMKQFGAEASEEIVGDISNTASDLLHDFVTGRDEADVKREYQEYIDKGYSSRDAFLKTLGSNALSTLEAALSAGISAGVDGARGVVKTSKTGKNTDLNMYMDAVQSMGEKTEAYKNLTDLKSQYGDDLSGVKSFGDNWKVGHAVQSAYEENDENYKDLVKNTRKMPFITKEQSDEINSIYKTNATLNAATAKNQKDIDSVVNDFSDEAYKTELQNVYNGQELKTFNSAARLIQSYAQLGIGTNELYDSIGSDVMSKEAIDSLYRVARISSVESEGVKNQAIRSVDEKWSKQFKKSGKFDATEIDGKNLTSSEKRIVQVMQMFSKLGMNIKVISDASNTSINGMEQNGYITINLKARYGNSSLDRARDAKGEYVLPTFAHESTHWMENVLGEEFGTFKQVLKDFVGERQWNSFKAQEVKRGAKVENAESEVVARMCEDMLNNPDTIDRIIAVADESKIKRIVARIRLWFSEIRAEIKKLMEGYSSNSEEAKFLAEFDDEFKKVQNMWIDMFQNALIANQNFKNQAAKIEASDKLNNVVTEDTVMLNQKTYEDGGKEFMENFLDHQIANGQLDESDKSDIIEKLEWAYNLSKEFSINPNFVDYRDWQKVGELKDAFNQSITAIVSNGDYDYNIDFATVCKKRKALDKVLNELVKSGIFDNGVPNEQCLTEIIAKIKEHGFEVACALCFVDAKRYRVGRWANNYLEGFVDDKGKKNYGYNEIVREIAKLEKVEFKEFDILKRSLLNLRKKGKTIDQVELTEDSKAMKYLRNLMDTNKKGSNNYIKAQTMIEHPELRKILAPTEIISSVGFDALRVEIPTLFNLVKASSGSSTPKLSLSEVAFTNEVAKDFKKLNPDKQNDMRDALRKVGGYRVQSFSDYMGNMILDYVQLFSNFAACKFKSHSYTKEYFYVKLFGMTGMKINMSVVPDSVTSELKERFKGVIDSKLKNKEYDSIRKEYLYYKNHAGMEACNKSDADYYDSEDGSYWKYITVDESFPLDKAFEIQNDSRYNKNCGIIWVGVSDHHIRALLRDERVPMVIPYHKSGINPVVAHMRGIAMYNDYTDYQNARIKNSKGKLVKLTEDNDKGRYTILKSYNFYDALDEAEREWTPESNRSIPQMAADKYLKLCRENDIDPIFSKFADEDNYFKLLEDFRLYDGDGNYAKQNDVTMTFPSDFKEIALESLQETAETNNDFKNRQEQLLEETKKIAAKYSSKVDSEYADAINSGDMKKASDMVERAAKDAGYDIRGYHGTWSFGFTKFKTNAIFLADNVELAESYSGVDGVKKISERKERKKLSDSELIKSLNKKAGKARYSKASAEEYERIKSKNADKLYSDIEDFESFINKGLDNSYNELMSEYNESEAEREDFYNEYHTYVDAPERVIKPVALSDIKERLNSKEIKSHIDDIKSVSNWINNLEPKDMLVAINQIIDMGKRYGLYTKDAWYKASGVEQIVAYDRTYNSVMWDLEQLSKILTNEIDGNGYVSGSNVISKEEFDKRVLNELSYDEIYGESFADTQKNRSGNYELYAKSGKSITIDCGGNLFRNIHVTDEMQEKLNFNGHISTTTDSIAKHAKNAGYDSVIFTNIRDAGDRGKFEWKTPEDMPTSTVYAILNQNYVSSADVATYDDNGKLIPLSERFKSDKNELRYSSKINDVPTFYSKMSNEIDAIKTDKIGAASLIPYLKGKGVKDEEIKWSGIETFIEGKKSVTKEELSEFARNSMLKIEENIIDDSTDEALKNLTDYLDENGIDYSYEDWISPMDDEFHRVLFEGDMHQKLNDGDITQEQYYKSMELAWYIVNGEKTHWSQYVTDGTKNYREILFKLPKSNYTNTAMYTHWGTEGVLAHARIDDMETSDGKMLFIEEIQSDWHNYLQKQGDRSGVTKDNTKLKKVGSTWFLINLDESETYGDMWDFDRVRFDGTMMSLDEVQQSLLDEYHLNDIPDAPFANGKYVEYVMKRLLRMAAEGGYDSIGWTTGKMQEERWSDEYAEGYRIEYDQDIPKFMNKYGKQWGAKAERSIVGTGNFKDEEQEVWTVKLTDSMKDSVLTNGQPMYSMKVSDEYISMNQIKLNFTTNLEAARERLDKGEYVISSEGDAIVSTKLGIIYVGGNENDITVNRIIKIVKTVKDESGKIDLIKDDEIQEMWLDAEEDIADGEQIDQKLFVTALKQSMQRLRKGKVRIVEYSAGNFRPFVEYGRPSRARSEKTLRALNRDALYRIVYNKNLADSGDEFQNKIKDLISYNTGIPKELFSHKVDEEDYLGLNKQLEKENEKLKKDVIRLARRLKLEGQITKGKVLDDSQLELVAKRILRNADKSEYPLSDLILDLRIIYGYILDNSSEEGKNINWDEMMGMAYEVAYKVRNQSKPTKIEDDYYKMVLSDIRGAKIKLSEEQIQEAKNQYGDQWRRDFLGKIRLNKEGRSLDSYWSEWANQYPGIFDSSVNPNDQVLELLDIYDAVKKGSEIYQNSMDDYAIRETAVDIYDKFWNVPTLTTISDKYEAEIKRLKFEHREEMAELKNNLKASNIRAELNAKHKAETDELKKHYQDMIKRIRAEKNQRMAEYHEKVQMQKRTAKEIAARKAMVNSITDTSKTLMDWMRKNNGKTGEVIPDALKRPVSMLLDAIDYSSKRTLNGNPTKKDISFRKAIEKIYMMVSDINKGQTTEDGMSELMSYVDFPPTYEEDLKNIFKTVNDIALKTGYDNEYILNEMSLEELTELNKIVKIMKQTVTTLNKRIASANAASIITEAQSTINENNELGAKNRIGNKVLKEAKAFFEWKNTLPIYAFDNLGKGAKNMFSELMDGWDKFAFNAKLIGEFSKATWTAEDYKRLTEDVREFKLLVLPSKAEAKRGGKAHEETVKMTVAHMMSIYCLSKREHAKGHFNGGGIVISDFKDGKEDVVQKNNIRISEDALNQIIDELKTIPKAIEIADSIQTFMNTQCSDWMNEVTMKRWGIKGATEKNYFPIAVDKNVLSTEARDNEKSIYALLNMSFTKPLTARASAQIEVGSIFDTFASHAGSMAKYNSMALPVLDIIKWYNYKEKDSDGNVTTLKGSIETAHGADAKNYIMQFLLDLNGNSERGRFGTLSKMVRGYKTAAVAANIQVAILQPISYLRASAVMDDKYLAKGMNIAKINKGVEKAHKYAGIAVWKDMNLFDTNISRGMDAMIKQSQTKKEALVEKSMALASLADKVTWGALWNACEYEVKDTTNLEGEEFNKAVAKRFRDVIYHTQVVDSTMTRTHIMRSSDKFEQIITNFMSEPSISMNVLQSLFINYAHDYRKTGSKAYAFKQNGKKILWGCEAYLLTSLAESVIRTFIGKYRGSGDDEDEIINALWKEFLTNLNPMNNLPIMRDAVSIFSGYKVDRIDMAAIQNAYYAYSSLKKNGMSYKTFYRMLTTVSQMTGLPISNILRDLEPIWNATVGDMYPELELNK